MPVPNSPYAPDGKSPVPGRRRQGRIRFAFDSGGGVSTLVGLMMTHTVLFWLRGDLTADDRMAFDAALRTLLSIPGASRAIIGKPAATPKREVIDDTYDRALELDFASLADQDVYQAHPVHLAFVNGQKSKWERVRVYDFEWL